MTRLDHARSHGNQRHHQRAQRHKANRRQERVPRTADWLVLAYFAGDNDLEGALLRDLKEMERVGSRPGQVEILAQMDRAAGFDASQGDWRTTRRYYVTAGAIRAASPPGCSPTSARRTPAIPACSTSSFASGPASIRRAPAR